jgi:hypothetical protein
MPDINENVIHNSQSAGTCRAHRGTLSSLGGLQDKNLAVLRDEESGLGCQNPGPSGLIRLATANATEGM